MSNQARSVVPASLGLALAAFMGACQTGGSAQPSGTPSIPSARVNPSALQAVAKAPPPPGATQRSSLGSGAVAVNTSNAPGDTDLYWVAQIDIDGDGTLEQTELLWDDEDRVLFAYAETDVPCWNGGTGVVAMLAAVNGQGNPRGRAEGSGFYAVYFDNMECGGDRAGLFGCTFDGMANVSAWAAVVVDSEGDEVDVVGVTY